MKLNVNFDVLNEAVKKMGAKPIVFETNSRFKHTKIDELLGTTSGQKIDINDIEVNEDGGGLFEYQGRQVLLFIPNHNPRYKSIYEVLDDSMKGNRFHISNCSTLEKMKRTNRYNKYHVTRNLSGKFKIYNEGNESHTVDAMLHVCKNCLEKLNYRNYKNENSQNRSKIFNEFNIGEFFETYSTLFDYLPNINVEKHSTGYTNDWSKVSRKYRDSKNYTCETCNTSFIKNKSLLHTHHINGNKGDNSLENLKAVCIDCHRKEPNHKHVMMTYEQLQKIHISRREQNKIQINSWDDVFKYTDISLYGYLELLKYDNKVKLPDVGYIIETNNKKVALDLAWITTKSKSALVTDYFYGFFNLKDWNILSLGEAMKKYYERNIQNTIIKSNQIEEKSKKAFEFQSMIDYTTTIESILEEMGASARGLHGKVTKVENNLSKDITFRLRRIATIRNKKMHTKNFTNYVYEDFKNDCEVVINYLKEHIS